jgi:hypothetical protein
LSHAGSIIRTSPRGVWWAAVPKHEWPKNGQSLAALQRRWHPAYGDRRQQLVFIGIGMDEARLRRDLDACLIGSDDDRAVDLSAFRRLRDPFPSWG